MSLLGDIQAALENDPESRIIGIDYRHVFGSFNTHVFRLAPSSRFRLDQSGLEVFFKHLQSIVPHEPFRVFNFLDRVEPSNYGEIIYREAIGTEEVIRTFTVDDASNHGGEEFEIGLREPEGRDLIRTIEVRLYPTAKVARHSSYGLTIFEEKVATTH